MEINVDRNSPFIIKGVNVNKIIVSKIGFEEYSKCLDVYAEQLGKGSKILAQRALNRARMIKQLSCISNSGTVVELDQESITNMPVKLFMTAHTEMFKTENDPVGQVISDKGDGVYSSIIYKLGTPFAFYDANAGSKPVGTEPKITELEFLARTGGDIEEVLCFNNDIDQTLALIRTCATPLGGETSLLRLPSWMLSQLTFADGFEIMKKVLPVFVQ